MLHRALAVLKITRLPVLPVLCLLIAPLPARADQFGAPELVWSFAPMRGPGLHAIDGIRAVAFAPDGGIVVATAELTGTGNDRLGVVRLSSGGQVAWRAQISPPPRQRQRPDDYWLLSLAVHADGSVALATPEAVYRLSGDGELQWRRTATEMYIDEAGAPLFLRDGSLAIGGYATWQRTACPGPPCREVVYAIMRRVAPDLRSGGGISYSASLPTPFPRISRPCGELIARPVFEDASGRVIALAHPQDPATVRRFWPDCGRHLFASDMQWITSETALPRSIDGRGVYFDGFVGLPSGRLAAFVAAREDFIAFMRAGRIERRATLPSVPGLAEAGPASRRRYFADMIAVGNTILAMSYQWIAEPSSRDQADPALRMYLTHLLLHAVVPGREGTIRAQSTLRMPLLRNMTLAPDGRSMIAVAGLLMGRPDQLLRIRIAADR